MHPAGICGQSVWLLELAVQRWSGHLLAGGRAQEWAETRVAWSLSGFRAGLRSEITSMGNRASRDLGALP